MAYFFKGVDSFSDFTSTNNSGDLEGERRSDAATSNSVELFLPSLLLKLFLWLKFKDISELLMFKGELDVDDALGDVDDDDDLGEVNLFALILLGCWLRIFATPRASDEYGDNDGD